MLIIITQFTEGPTVLPISLICSKLIIGVLLFYKGDDLDPLAGLELPCWHLTDKGLVSSSAPHPFKRASFSLDIRRGQGPLPARELGLWGRTLSQLLTRKLGSAPGHTEPAKQPEDNNLQDWGLTKEWLQGT